MNSIRQNQSKQDSMSENFGFSVFKCMWNLMTNQHLQSGSSCHYILASHLHCKAIASSLAHPVLALAHCSMSSTQWQSDQSLYQQRILLCSNPWKPSSFKKRNNHLSNFSDFWGYFWLVTALPPFIVESQESHSDVQPLWQYLEILEMTDK